jgi:PIN domain nuclease of toxin-antitoxin system
MDFLIDTHVFIWYATGDKRLSETVISIIEDEENNIFFSMASLWEMAIKINIGRLQFKKPFEKIITQQISSNNYHLLNILPKHIFQLSNINNFHKDPFDRLIISQAVTDNLIVLTKDKYFKKYNISVLW